MCKSDAYYFCGHNLVKNEESKNPKNFVASIKYYASTIKTIVEIDIGLIKIRISLPKKIFV